MSEMIERVTDAIRKVNNETDGLTYSELTRAMASAAIEAMRVPTDDMLWGDPCCTSDGRSYVVPVMEIWPKMIDAALAVSGDRKPDAACSVSD